MLIQPGVLTSLLRLFKRKPTNNDGMRCLFVDGDMPLKPALRMTEDLLKNYDKVFIYRISSEQSAPRSLVAFMKKYTNYDISLFMIKHFAAGKETTDKYIMMSIQQCIDLYGARKIGVITGDMDFYDMSSAVQHFNPMHEIVYDIYMPKTIRANLKIRPPSTTINFV